jgi:hypothetical protein
MTVLDNNIGNIMVHAGSTLFSSHHIEGERE